MSVKETLSGRASQRAETGALGLAGAHFLGAFLLSAGQIGSGLAPFGVAASAASAPGLRRAAALAGACLGYLVTGPLEWGIRYAAACVFVFTLLFIFQDARWARAPWVSPLLAALVTAVKRSPTRRPRRPVVRIFRTRALRRPAARTSPTRAPRRPVVRLPRQA